MSNKIKILLSIVVIFFIFSIATKYYKYLVLQDYYISAEVSCDTETESCFVWDCDLTDEDCDQTPYKYIWKYAKNIPTCTIENLDSCPELTCQPNEDDCEYIFCSADTLSDEEFCFNDII